MNQRAFSVMGNIVIVNFSKDVKKQEKLKFAKEILSKNKNSFDSCLWNGWSGSSCELNGCPCSITLPSGKICVWRKKVLLNRTNTKETISSIDVNFLLLNS